MKKIVLMLALSAVCFSARADLLDRSWIATALGVTATDPNVNMTTGEAVGWYCEVFNVTDAGHVFGGLADWNSAFSTVALDMSGGEPGISPLGDFYEGYGYALNAAIFGPATDSDTVQFILYNNAVKGSAGYYIASANLLLPDVQDGTPAPGETDVTFNFDSSTWQAIPEPATFLLFGIGGMGAWLLRRRQQA